MSNEVPPEFSSILAAHGVAPPTRETGCVVPIF